MENLRYKRRLALVRLAIIAAVRRAVAPLSRAADLACLERERCEAAELPSFFRAASVAGDRVVDGLRRGCDWPCS